MSKLVTGNENVKIVFRAYLRQKCINTSKQDQNDQRLIVHIRLHLPAEMLRFVIFVCLSVCLSVCHILHYLLFTLYWNVVEIGYFSGKLVVT